MNIRHEDQQQRQQLLTIVDRGTIEQLFTFLQGFHRRPFQNVADVLIYEGVIDDQIDFIDCTGTKYSVTPLIIAAGKGSYEKTKILLVHGANPNKQCATGDTALNLAVHRQKYSVVGLLLQYHANPNLFNQAGKTALHRAVASYNDENAIHIRALLEAGADLTIEDRNQRIPLDEAVIANRPEIVDILLSYDRTLVEHAYRAAIIASRHGHDQCLEILLNYGMNPNIADRTNTTPLHVAIRSLKLSTTRILLANGADPNLANNRGETATSIAEFLQPDQQQDFLNILHHTPQIASSDPHLYRTENAISNIYPLLRNHSNWTLDSDEFRSRTAPNSSTQNLLDTNNRTYWCSIKPQNAWVIFDLKHQYTINGVRIIGCENQSTPKNGHFDVSNALNGPWLKVKDFTCLFTQGNKNDFFFPVLTTRFIRVFILDNYGGEDIRIQEISFYGVDTCLINLLKEYNLENSLDTLLANGINDQETLDENQDKILNSSNKYLHVNDHFQFIRLTESLRSPQLTFLEWFNPPQTTAIAGERFQTFSVAADEGVTNRIKLEEKFENNPQATTVLMRDLEPIQGHSLVDFPDYTIHNPGRYKIRVVSVESPHIHTSWQEIVVGKKPLEITVRTADRSHLYTTGIIPPKLPSTPTTDITDEITERESFDKSHTFRHTPDPYRGDSHDNNEEDAEDSEPMSEIQQHNRDRSARYNFKSGVRDYGTQSEERSTRTIGTMSEPIKTRNSGNEVQPQSSATQTTGLLQQQLPYNLREQDEINFKPSTSQRSQYDSRTNGYYPTQRSTSHDHRNKYVSSSSIPPRKKDYLDYDQHQVPHLSQYNDDPDDQYVVTRNDYQRSTKHQPRSSSQTRQYNPSSTNLHRTPSPPVEYRSTLLTQRHRSRSPSNDHQFIELRRSRSPSPPIQQYKQTSTNGHRTISPSSQRRSRQLQRSPSPPPSRHHTSSMTRKHRTPSPPIQYRSTSPKNYSRKTKDRPQMVSTETDTSLDGMKPQQHQGVQKESPATREYGVSTNLERQYPTDLNAKSNYSQYETLNSSLPQRQDYITISPYRDNYQLLQNDQRLSAQKNYQQRPERNNSYNNNYEEIPLKYDQSVSSEYNRSFDRTKEHTSRPSTSNHQQQLNRAIEQTLDEEEQQVTLTFNDDGTNEEYIRQLPIGGSISNPSSTIYPPDTLSRTYGQNKSSTHQKQDPVNNRGKIPEFPLHHGQQRTTSLIDSPVYNIGTQNILYQSPNNEVTIPFETRYIHDSDVDDEFTTTNNNIRSSTLKRDSLISRNSRILLLPVLNSSRTYVFEKQSLPKDHIRQSKINGNFYLAASPTLRSLNSSFQNDESEIDPLTQMIDSTNLNGHGLRSQVA